MNKVFLIGNLAKDPEMKKTKEDINMCIFPIAVNRTFTAIDGNKKVDFLNIITFRKTADICYKYLSKGKKVGITGKIQNEKYTNKDGETKYITNIVAEEVELLSPNSQQPAKEYSDEETIVRYEDLKVEDLPF